MSAIFVIFCKCFDDFVSVKFEKFLRHWVNWVRSWRSVLCNRHFSKFHQKFIFHQQSHFSDDKERHRIAMFTWPWILEVGDFSCSTKSGTHRALDLIHWSVTCAILRWNHPKTSMFRILIIIHPNPTPASICSVNPPNPYKVVCHPIFSPTNWKLLTLPLTLVTIEEGKKTGQSSSSRSRDLEFLYRPQPATAAACCFDVLPLQAVSWCVCLYARCGNSRVLSLAFSVDGISFVIVSCAVLTTSVVSWTVRVLGIFMLHDYRIRLMTMA